MSSADNAPTRDQLDRRELADLSALADGTLAPARRAEVEARVAASPELSALYERERRVVGLLQESRATVRAPATLRTRLERARPSRPVRARRAVLYGGGLAGALAVVALAIVLVLPGGSPGAPSVSQAAALAARGASTSAPAPDPSSPTVKLAVDIENVYFPNWSKSFGWSATGERRDTLGGHRAITVYYDWRGERLAYTIVSAPTLSAPRSAVSTVKGTVLRTFTLGSRTVVTWRRAGHTCVLSAAGVPVKMLHNLAAWQAPGLGAARG